MKDIFHIRHLHLGHVADSFALRYILLPLTPTLKATSEYCHVSTRDIVCLLSLVKSISCKLLSSFCPTLTTALYAFALSLLHTREVCCSRSATLKKSDGHC